MTQENPHPRYNAQLFGFNAIEETLAQEFHSQTLHHSIMLCGAKGIGKATLAYRFARFVFSGGADLRALETDNFSLFGGTQPSESLSGSEGALYMPESHGIFKRVGANSHADLLSIEPLYDAKKDAFKDEIQADAARKISDFLSLTPAEAAYRVVIIDAADQLNEKAANALLKSIEEPPSYTYILLVCHNPLALLPTLRSRCRMIKCATPDLTAFGAVLAQRASNIDLHHYGALNTLSQGSPGFAVQLYAFDALNLYEIVARHLEKRRDIAETIGLATELCASKRSDAWYMSKYVLLSLIERSLLLHKVAAQPIFTEEYDVIKRFEARMGQTQLIALRDRMRQLLHDTDTLNLNKTQAMSLLLSAA